MLTGAPPHMTRWEQWQESRISKKLLPEAVRRQGYAVLLVLPICREVFLEVAALLSLYGYLRHHKRRIPAHLEACWALWRENTQKLLTELKGL